MASPSASLQWQARSWQHSCCVTGVTQSVLRRGDFTPFLQLANLICAIAPLGRSPPRAPRTTPERPPRGLGGTVPHRPEQPRTESHGAARSPSEGAGADRTPGFRRDRAPRGAGSPHRPPDAPRGAQGGADRPSRHAVSAQKRSRWTRRSPARSDDDTLMAQVWRPLGRAPVIWSYGWAIRVGGPKSPVVTRRQGYVRPRCAAAEYPQAVRGPLPRGTGDVHRACGWT